MRRCTLLAVAVLATAVTGCSSGSDGSTNASATVADGSSAGSPSATGSASPSASPSAGATPFAGDSARTILAKVNDATDTATTVHVKGRMTEDGESIALNLKLKYGAGAYGYLKIGKDLIQIRRVGKTSYMKAGDAFWKKNAPGSEKLFGGQWIKGNYKSPAFAALNIFTTRQLVTKALTPDGRISRVAGKDVGGVATVGLKDNDKSDPGVLYISTVGKAYPLLIESTGTKSTGSVTFSEWDQPVTLTAPAGAIDIDKLST